MTYYNFKKDLAKEKDSVAQARLNDFYNTILPEFEVISIDYNTDYGQFLQTAGVDKVLVKRNKYNGIDKQVFFQEKIRFDCYNDILFEYEKRSGNAGWAVCPREKSDFLLYYQNGLITMMKTAEVRDWLTANLDEYKKKYFKQTDNKNVIIPKSVVKANIKTWEWKLSDYQNKQKRG